MKKLFWILLASSSLFAVEKASTKKSLKKNAKVATPVKDDSMIVNENHIEKAEVRKDRDAIILEISGHYPSGCYFSDGLELIESGNEAVELKLTSRKRKGMCTMALVEFKDSLDLRLIGSGKKKVKVALKTGNFEQEVTIP